MFNKMYFLIVVICLMASVQSQPALRPDDANSARNNESSIVNSIEFQPNFKEKLVKICEGILNLANPVDNNVVTKSRILQIVAYKVLGKAPEICGNKIQYRNETEKPSSDNVQCNIDIDSLNKMHVTLKNITQSVKPNSELHSTLVAYAADQVLSELVSFDKDHLHHSNMTGISNLTNDNYIRLIKKIQDTIHKDCLYKFSITPQYDGYTEQLALIARKLLENVAGELDDKKDLQLFNLYMEQVKELDNKMNDMKVNTVLGAKTKFLAAMARVLLRSALNLKIEVNCMKI